MNCWNEQYLIIRDSLWLSINIPLVTFADLRLTHFLPPLLGRHIPSTVELKQKLSMHLKCNVNQMFLL